MVLLACSVRGAGEDAYGVNVHAELERRTRRRVARGAVYMTLDRLEKKGLLSSYLTDADARTGRARETLLPRDQTRVGGAARIAPGPVELVGWRSDPGYLRHASRPPRPAY